MSVEMSVESSVESSVETNVYKEESQVHHARAFDLLARRWCVKQTLQELAYVA